LGFYLFLALTALVRRVGLRALGIFVGRCALHVMLVIATAAVLVQVMGIAAERAVGLSVIDLPPLVGLQMFAVATSLAPLAVSRPRSRKEKSKRSQERPHRAEEPGREEATVTPAQASRPPHSEPAEEMVRISFERIAGQLPADAFRLPLDRLGANLLEPGHLLVPRRLLGPQLAEGRARVQWSVVAEQFPRQAVTVSDADIAARLP